MKLLRVISSMDPTSGGPCQGIRNSIPELQKLGVENQVVCVDAPYASYLGMDSFPITALGPSKSPWAYSPLLLPWLFQNLPLFDAVIVHGLWQYHGYAVQKALYYIKKNRSEDLKKTPRLFVMPHGMLDPYFQRAAGRKLKALRNWAYWKLIEHRLIEQARGVFFTCERELELARTTFRPYKPGGEYNVGYGIQNPPVYSEDMRAAFLARCPEVEDRPYILFLSRIHKKKGVDLLIQAYNRLITSSMRESLPVLVIAGPGLESSFGQKVQEEVDRQADLTDSILFPGMLSGAAKWGAFYGCEALALPSHQENFGIAVVEALACGKPVLISDQVNICLEIGNVGAGIVSTDTEEGCLTMLETWLRLSKDKKEAMFCNAKQCFEAHFSIGPNAKRLKEAVGA